MGCWKQLPYGKLMTGSHSNSLGARLLGPILDVVSFVDWRTTEGLLVSWLNDLMHSTAFQPPVGQPRCPIEVAMRCDAWIHERLRTLDFADDPPPDVRQWLIARLCLARILASMLAASGEYEELSSPLERVGMRMVEELLVQEWYDSLHLLWAELVRDSDEQSLAE